MASLGRFGVRRLVVIGSAAALGSGVASAGLLSAAPSAGAAPSCTGTTTVTCTFSYTGDAQSFTVPAGVTRMTIDARGAQGGTNGGLGGEATETIPATPGAVFQVLVGGMGADFDNGASGGFNGGGNGEGLNGGGGGGASEVVGLIVAGGGGGGADVTSNGKPASGGSGGGLAGGDGVDLDGGSAGGKGGTQSGPGAGGTGTGIQGHPGVFGTGGHGIAGGGGGLFGGGGSASTAPADQGGAGGGSGFTFGGTGMQNGVQAGNGLVTISYPGAGTGSGTPPVQCAAGQVSHVLSATTNAGPISGLFCVNRFGVGTYTQGSVSGTGFLAQAFGGTVAVAHGTDLNLAGLSVGGFSVFTETAPVQDHGTFSLS